MILISNNTIKDIRLIEDNPSTTNLQSGGLLDKTSFLKSNCLNDDVYIHTLLGDLCGIFSDLLSF